MNGRFFTLPAARRTLRRIRPTAERLHRLYRELDLRRPPEIDGDTRVDPLFFTMLGRLVEGIARLDREGLKADDLRRGMLDFPALRDGRRVLLCWRVGEPSLLYWHEPDTRCERRPVDEDGPWDHS